MLPLNAFAYTKENTSIEWEKTSYKGETYLIEYWHPKNHDKIYIYNQSGSSNVRNYYFIYANKDTKFVNDNKYIITNSSVIKTTASGYSYMSPKFETLSQNTNDLLFNPNDTAYRSNKFEKITANAEENYQYIDYNFNSAQLVVESGTKEFEILYTEWYYQTYNKYPPLVSELDEVEYMKGEYYIIAKQRIIKPSEWESMTGKKSNKIGDYGYYDGYVETCKNAKLTSKDGMFVYVVISTEKSSGDLITFENGTLFDNVIANIKDLLFFMAGDSRLQKINEVIEKEGENGEFRNEYPLFSTNTTRNFFYSDDETLNRYYFSTLEDATKFVLYGTAAAMYDYKEEGKTRYGYGYTDIIYNNYDIDGHPKKVVPNNLYPLKRINIILEWHEENVYERDYLWISIDYYPYAATLSTEKKLTISQNLNPKYYIAYKTEENEEGFAIRDFLLYQETDKYNSPSIQHFQIYHDELDKKYVSNSWNLKWCDVNLKMFKKTYDENGNIIISSGSIYEDEWVIEHMKGQDGKEYIYNSLTNEYIEKNKEENTFTDQDGDGIYENGLGETLDPSTLTGDLDKWYASLKQYMTALENTSAIIKDFTAIINNATMHMEELVRMLNAFYKNLPSIFRTLIIYVILAAIIMRVTRRN